MAEFPVNPERRDPYPDFKFRVQWDGQSIPGISRVSGLSRITEVIKHREGGDPSTDRKAPGRTDFEPITLERGTSPLLVSRSSARAGSYASGTPRHSAGSPLPEDQC
jgi:hypothetical protein